MYEALEQRFGEEKEGDFYPWHYRSAQTNYLLSLIVTGRPEDAVAFMEKTAKNVTDDQSSLSISSNALARLDRAGFTGRVFDFLHDALSKDPSLPVWSMYASTGARSGNSERMIATFREVLAREDLNDAARRDAAGEFAEALLAADEVEEALIVMQTRLDLLAKTDPSAAAEVAMDLTEVAHVLGREELRETSLDRAVVLYRRSNADEERYSVAWEAASKAERLMQVEAPGAAIVVLRDAMTIILTELKQRELKMGSPASSSMYDDVSRMLVELVKVYHEEGRHQDVLTIVENSPYWENAELGELMSMPHSSYEELAVPVAAALAAAERDEEALEVLKAGMLLDGSDDDAFELLLALEGQDAIKFLDRLFVRDRFEERPLIWKAKLQLEAGDVDEAEETIREAIAIDPSDGEQGRGDRMRAYGVLADVLERQGDEKAEVYRGAVRAVRLAEEADRFFAAGLIKRAIAMYEESLTHFTDAYCIQSRVAIQLSRIGRHEEAAEHYRRAYELMPSSFGRVESHCFGCEGIFAVGDARTIAEEVFERLVAEQPNNPQVHYLRGYLLDAMGRDQDALTSFWKAVELDADYLNAWSRIAGMADETFVSVEDRDKATLNLLRLDPLGRHTSPDLDQVLDARELWLAVEQANRVEMAPTDVFELRATREREQKFVAHQNRHGGGMAVHHASFSFNGGPLGTPREVLAKHQVVQLLDKLLDN